ncbi:MAG: 2-hydroxyacyl-CoA dehydratase family protein [Coprothermobacterota bacterium]|nr:2-hydroxyacyl-CoA dehydratase family protein [Coprothermobacterota bacterium]
MSQPFVALKGRAFWTCSYLPCELSSAFGYQPRRFWAQAGGTPRADRVFPPNLCSGVRASLEEAMRQATAEDLFLLADCCDADRRLADALEASFPGQTFLLFLPRAEESWPELASELRRLAGFLAKKSRRPLEEEALRAAIIEEEALRQSRRQFHARQSLGGVSPITYYEALRSWCGRAPEGSFPLGDPPAEESSDQGERAPILLLGNSLDERSFWEMLEELSFTVVADDLCYGEKLSQVQVQAGVEPFEALARAYLARPPCPRTQRLEERWDDVLRRGIDRGAIGAIFIPTKFCDYYAYELPILVPRLRAAGLPTLVLEMDYGQVSPEQLRTRLEAFRESL